MYIEWHQIGGVIIALAIFFWMWRLDVKNKTELKRSLRDRSEYNDYLNNPNTTKGCDSEKNECHLTTTTVGQDSQCLHL